MTWQQLSGCAYTAGGDKSLSVLRVWDLNRESCAGSIPIIAAGLADAPSSMQVPSPVSTLSNAVGALIAAGTVNGGILSFDLRSPVRLINAMKCVLNLHLDFFSEYVLSYNFITGHMMGGWFQSSCSLAGHQTIWSLHRLAATCVSSTFETVHSR